MDDDGPSDGSEPSAPEAPRLRLRTEAAIVLVFYLLYTAVRDIHGSHQDDVRLATTHAHQIVSLEKHLGIFREAWLQRQFVGHQTFIRYCDAFYGTVHFVAVAAVLLIMFFRYRERYRLWRNTLALTTGLGLIGFAAYPLLPPRLLPGHGFVDTIDTIGGIWNFSNGAVSDLSNQFAAMPSLHTGWSTWCALAMIPVIRPWWGKVLMALYPVATVFCIVITANHYFADAVGGLVTLGLGYLLGRALTRAADRWRARRAVTAAN